jgi:hypothetical protein
MKGVFVVQLVMLILTLALLWVAQKPGSGMRLKHPSMMMVGCLAFGGLFSMRAEAAPELNDLFMQYGALVGVAALIAVMINVAKTLKWISDGQAQNWSAGLNLIGMALLLIAKVFRPDLDLVELDSQAAQLATVLSVVVGYVLQLLSSKFVHEYALKGLPLIGKSYSEATDEKQS